MKILVFGHSDSDGSKLANPADAWPRVLQVQLSELGLEAQVAHRTLYASSSAPQFIERELTRQSPDVVVLATSTHGVLLRLASVRVREVLGVRAGSIVAHMERFISNHNGRPDSVRGKTTLRLRRAARAALRAKSDLSVEELIRIYGLCFDALARAENTQTIILGGAGYTPEVENESPGWSGLQSQIGERLRVMAVEHHFDWIVHEELLGGPQGKLPYYFPDGIHTGEQSQKIVAEALLPLITGRN